MAKKVVLTAVIIFMNRLRDNLNFKLGENPEDRILSVWKMHLALLNIMMLLQVQPCNIPQMITQGDWLSEKLRLVTSVESNAKIISAVLHWIK